MNRRLLSFAEGEPQSIKPQPAAGRRYLLYVHIPFCDLLCPFCSFHRVRFVPDLADRYFTALRAEIRHYAELGFDFADVYVGGGTPTVDVAQLTKTLDVIRGCFEIERISVETNPDHLRKNVLEPLRAAGVNRLSVGIQSFDDQLLKEMQRFEKYGSGADLAERLAHAAGYFDTLNADMIFNFPHQDRQSLARDIQRLIDVGIDQASFYPLMAAESVRQRMARQLGVVNYSRERSFYYQILDGMTPTFEQSSVWCFSRRPGLVDEYIIDHDEYVGVGSGAFSYLNGTLYATSFSILAYDRLIAAQHLGITHARPLSRREQLRFHLLTSLFALGLDPGVARKRFGERALRELAGELGVLRALGSIRPQDTQLRLTRRGMYHWVVMMREFLNGINNLRDEMRADNRAEYQASYEEPALQGISIR
jgi:coproporphyrinogen III oxidase-like Fe-S oxidoreductase